MLNISEKDPILKIQHHDGAKIFIRALPYYWVGDKVFRPQGLYVAIEPCLNEIFNTLSKGSNIEDPAT